MSDPNPEPIQYRDKASNLLMLICVDEKGRPRGDERKLLMRAIDKEQWPLVLELLSRGVSPHVFIPESRERGISRVLSLCRKEWLGFTETWEVVERLLDAGAIPTRRDVENWDDAENFFRWGLFGSPCRYEKWNEMRTMLRRRDDTMVAIMATYDVPATTPRADAFSRHKLPREIAKKLCEAI